MPAYGKVKVDTITYDSSGTATDVSVANIATKASPTFTGTVTVPTPSADDNSTKAASTAYVQTELGDYALKAGPTFTGTVNAADLVLSGDLTVNGSTTTIDTTTLQVEDKNVVIGKVSSPSDTTADGGGWTLKGDSDKTFNWVNATDAWTSSEHIHLGDDKKLLIGTGSDLEIYHSGSHSNIKDAGTGQLNLWSNTFQFYNAAGNKTSMKIVEDAQVELYYDNSKKLETASGGVTITGTLAATAVTGDGSGLTNLPPGGNTVDLVADGAIAAGKPVIIKSNGKVAQVGESMTPRSTPAHKGTTWAYNADTDIADDECKYSASINCGTNLIFSMWFNETDDKWTSNVSYIDDTSNENIKVKYGTGYVHGNVGGVNYKASVALAYLGNNKVCIFYNGASTGAGTALIAEINPSTRAITYGSDVQISATGNNLAVSYDTDNSRILFAWCGNSSDNGFYQSYSFSGTTLSGAGSATQFALVGSNNGVRSINSVYDTNANRHVIVYEYKDYSNKGYAFSVETTGSSMNVSSLLEWNSNAMLTETMGLDVCFDSVNNRTVVRWSEANNANGKLVGLVCNASTGAVTTSGSISNTVGTYMTSNFHSDMIFDPISGSPYHAVGFQSGNHWMTFYKLSYNSSNGQYSTNGGSTLWATSEVRKYVALSSFGNSSGDIQVMANREFESTATDRHHGVQRMQTMSATSNLTASAQNFLGFAENAINDTATGTILLPGNIVGNQSGLTPGSHYYVKDDGTLGSGGNAAHAGGLAIASDKMMIRYVPKS